MIMICKTCERLRNFGSVQTALAKLGSMNPAKADELRRALCHCTGPGSVGRASATQLDPNLRKKFRRNW